MNPEIISMLRPWGRAVLILLLLATLVFSVRLSTFPAAPVAAADLPRVSLQGYHRLLILAPHCDDETLGTAGLILAAQRAGIQVRVVIATNGDGYLFATMQDFHKVYPHAGDFIRFGEVRQQESLAALKVLGVQASQVDFLSYPDRGTPSEWTDHWSAADPYRSPYSRDTHSPYARTYDPASVYAGEDFLRDLLAILESYRPDLIVYPHSEDVHPDHWGLNAFTRLSIALAEHTDPAFRPVELTYLVHRADFPVIRGLKPLEDLVPPPALYLISPNWLRLDLPPEDVTLKVKAVQQYRTQLPLLHGLMDSFVRANELFAPVASADLGTAASGDPHAPSSWTDPAGLPIQAVQLDPERDYLSRNALPASDLTAVYAARSGEMLWFCGEVRGEAGRGVEYILRLKALTPGGIVDYRAMTGEAQTGWQHATIRGRDFCAQVRLADLGHPWAVFLGAQSEGIDRIVLDQTGWQMVFLGR